MKLDVIIPAYKPGKELAIIIERLLKQDYPVDRIIIINTGKEFFIKEFPYNDRVEIIHISKKEFDHGNTRHMGMCMSDADYVLFMTMDAVPADRQLTRNLLNSFNTHGETIAVSYARQVPKKGCRFQERYIRNFNYPGKSCVKTLKDREKMGIKTYFCSDVCAMYDRKLYFENGGFEKKIIFNEDMVYAARAVNNGYAVYYCADARVYHSHNYSCMEQFRRNFDLGVSQADYPEIFGSLSSESEGVKMLLSTAAYMARNKRWYEILYLIINSAFKFTGYRLGINYKMLNRKTILKLTANKDYWN